MSGANKSYQQGFWGNHYSAWKASGLRQQAYCEQSPISYQSFIYQHKRLSTTQAPKTPMGFIKTSTASIASGNQQVFGLQLVLLNGIRIGIGTEVNAALPQKVLQVSGAMPC